ncbi:MAG TPA: hypothetical protein VH479_18465, partial [Acidimicrobiales bacterium]
GDGDGTGPWARTGLWGPMEPVGRGGGRDRSNGYPPRDRPGGPADLGPRPGADQPMQDAPGAWTAPPPPPPARSAPPSRSGPPVPPAAPGPPPDPGQSGTTSGGLTRRVRGAQMPTTEPLLLRRGQGSGGGGEGRGEGKGAAAGPPGPAPSSGLGGRRDPLEPESTASANEVFSFLSNFTAGVQRGLREAPRPNGHHKH